MTFFFLSEIGMGIPDLLISKDLKFFNGLQKAGDRVYSRKPSTFFKLPRSLKIHGENPWGNRKKLPLSCVTLSLLDVFLLKKTSQFFRI